MRIVLDSNIYISAALSVHGPSRTIVRLSEKGWFEVAIADTITDEVENILQQKLRWSSEKVDLWMRYILSFTHRVEPKLKIHDCRDQDDNHILECAIEANAEIIVTGDKHLLDLHPYRGISILTPRAFLELTA
jgi:putative PIN family toxin of toxin-antitoxin system